MSADGDVRFGWPLARCHCFARLAEKPIFFVRRRNQRELPAVNATLSLVRSMSARGWLEITLPSSITDIERMTRKNTDLAPAIRRCRRRVLIRLVMIYHRSVTFVGFTAHSARVSTPKRDAGVSAETFVVGGQLLSSRNFAFITVSTCARWSIVFRKEV